jgi:hypothetical protein
MLKVYPYKLGSESARDLANALGVKQIIPGGKFRPGPHHTILNWGSSDMPFRHADTINDPAAVRSASNKLSALIRMDEAGVSVVPFTTNPDRANEWLREGKKVIVRHKLSANSGNGIEVVRPNEGSWRRALVPRAPLYTKYVKKNREFRVHVFDGHVFDFQEKKKRNGTQFEDDDHALIRSHLHGWIFCRTGVVCPQSVKDEAVKAVRALGLDFGAVDVVVGERDNEPYVLEVNTAPGLEQTTLENYVEQIEDYVRSNSGSIGARVIPRGTAASPRRTEYPSPARTTQPRAIWDVQRDTLAPRSVRYQPGNIARSQSNTKPRKAKRRARRLGANLW